MVDTQHRQHIHETNMVTLSLDPALAGVIPLEDYPNIAEDILAGRFPYPPTRAQFVEMESFLTAVAAALSRDSIHVAAYTAYVKGIVIIGNLISRASQQDTDKFLNSINTLVGQAAAILLSVLGGHSIELSRGVATGSEWFLVQVLSAYGQWIKNLPSRPASVHENKGRTTVDQQAVLDAERKEDEARITREQHAKEEEITRSQQEAATQALLSQDADNDVAQQEALLAHYKTQASMSHLGSNATAAPVVSGSGTRSWRLEEASPGRDAVVGTGTKPKEEEVDSSAKPKEEKDDDRPDIPPANEPLPDTDSDSDSDDAPDPPPSGIPAVIPVPVKSLPRPKLPLPIGSRPAPEVIARWQMEHGVSMAALPVKYRKVMLRRVVNFVRHAEAHAYNEWVANGARLELDEARRALKPFSLKDSGGEYAHWNPPSETIIVNRYEEHIHIGFNQMLKQRKTDTQTLTKNGKIQHKDPMFVHKAESISPMTAQFKPVAELNRPEFKPVAELKPPEFKPVSEFKPREMSVSEVESTDAVRVETAMAAAAAADQAAENLKANDTITGLSTAPNLPVLSTTPSYKDIEQMRDPTSHFVIGEEDIPSASTPHDPAEEAIESNGGDGSVQHTETVPTKTVEAPLFEPWRHPRCLIPSLPYVPVLCVTPPPEDTAHEMRLDRSSDEVLAEPVILSQFGWHDFEGPWGYQVAQSFEQSAEGVEQQSCDAHASLAPPASPDNFDESFEDQEQLGAPESADTTEEELQAPVEEDCHVFKGFLQVPIVKCPRDVTAEEAKIMRAEQRKWDLEAEDKLVISASHEAEELFTLEAATPPHSSAQSAWSSDNYTFSPPKEFKIDWADVSDEEMDARNAARAAAAAASMFPEPSKDWADMSDDEMDARNAIRAEEVRIEMEEETRAQCGHEAEDERRRQQEIEDKRQQRKAELRVRGRGFVQALSDIESVESADSPASVDSTPRRPMQAEQDSPSPIRSMMMYSPVRCSTPLFEETSFVAELSPTPPDTPERTPQAEQTSPSPKTALLSPSPRRAIAPSFMETPPGLLALSPSPPGSRARSASPASPSRSRTSRLLFPPTISSASIRASPPGTTPTSGSSSRGLTPLTSPPTSLPRTPSPRHQTKRRRSGSRSRSSSRSSSSSSPSAINDSFFPDNLPQSTPMACRDRRHVSLPVITVRRTRVRRRHSDRHGHHTADSDADVDSDSDASMGSDWGRSPASTRAPDSPAPTRPGVEEPRRNVSMCAAPTGMMSPSLPSSGTLSEGRVPRGSSLFPPASPTPRREEAVLIAEREECGMIQEPEVTQEPKATEALEASGREAIEPNPAEQEAAQEEETQESTPSPEPSNQEPGRTQELLTPAVTPAPTPATRQVRDWDVEMPWVPERLRIDRTWTKDELRQVRNARKRFARNGTGERHTSASDAASGYDSASPVVTSVSLHQPGAVTVAAELSIVIEESRSVPTTAEEQAIASPEEARAEEPKAKPENPVVDPWERKPWVPLELRTDRRWTDDEVKRVKNLRAKWLKKRGKRIIGSDASTCGSVRSIASWGASSPPGTPPAKPKALAVIQDETPGSPSPMPDTATPTPKTTGSLLDQLLAMRAQPSLVDRMSPSAPPEETPTPRAPSLQSRLGPTPSRVQNLRNMWEQGGMPTPTRAESEPLPHVLESNSKSFRDRVQAFTPPPPPPPPRTLTPPPPPPPKPRVRRGYEAPTKASEKREDVSSTRRSSDAPAPLSYGNAATRRSVDGRATPASRPSSAEGNRPPSRPSSAASRPIRPTSTTRGAAAAHTQGTGTPTSFPTLSAQVAYQSKAVVIQGLAMLATGG
ncbi:hypothetical protein CspHIS471_0410480 [Cutaneotrichosporon sp. HIS471]|nr:hypothetical protein CspHIS471_0410480 [Cutaneotrichosporon sp. HIS471]